MSSFPFTNSTTTVSPSTTRVTVAEYALPPETFDGTSVSLLLAELLLPPLPLSSFDCSDVGIGVAIGVRLGVDTAVSVSVSVSVVVLVQTL